MTTPSYKKLFSLEIQLRTIAAILFLITEKIAGKLLRVPETALGYYTLAFLCALILLCLVRRIGDSPMVHDLEEICFYDVLLAPLGLFMQQIGQSDYLFFVLADAIVLLKIIRLIWWGKNQQGELAASWPVFGILGFFRKNRFIEDLSLNHKKMVYLACGLSIVVATVLRWAFGPDFGGTPYLIFGLVALIKVIKPITHDIITTTEQKEAAERERGALERQAEIDANIKERNADLRQATHDMLGPVRAVNTIATSILASSDIAEVHQAARHIKNGLTELDDLMREVVVMSQIVTQLKTANDEIIDMGKLGDYFQLYLAPIAIERNIHLTVDDAPYKVMSNAWLLKRIIYNLLMNAINHGDKQTFVRLYLRKNRKWCYVRIWDTGPGIPNANGLDRAANFTNLLESNTPSEHNEQEDNSTAFVAGYGLGLRGVMRMCDTLGIALTLVSKPGKGTVFRFRVPLADPAKAPTASQEDALFERHRAD